MFTARLDDCMVNRIYQGSGLNASTFYAEILTFGSTLNVPLLDPSLKEMVQVGKRGSAVFNMTLRNGVRTYTTKDTKQVQAFATCDPAFDCLTDFQVVK